jgi:hypothetical protein
MEIELAARARNRFNGLRGLPSGRDESQFRSEIAAKAIRPLCDLHH